MLHSKRKNLTNFSRFFINPSNSTHRQYEALRAHFVENLPIKEIVHRFGYTEGSFRVLLSQFRDNPNRQFFLTPAKGPHSSPKRDPVRDQAIALRKQNLSVYDICRVLEAEGHKISHVCVSRLLKEEGFSRLARRRNEERPPYPHPIKAPVTDVRKLNLAPRCIRTKFGGLYLFVPYLASIDFDNIFKQAGFPSSNMIPAGHAMRSLLALKLFGSARHSHVMSYVLDQGLALFAGLNEIPKRSFLTEYSCRIAPPCYLKVIQHWFDAMGTLGLPRGESFDVDFHTIPFHGEDILMEKHYISKRSRRQKGILVFLGQDANTRVLCYGNAALRKHEQNDEILKFIDFWKQRTGNLPKELIFDSRVTTYANLNRINRMQIDFITLRRRSEQMLNEVFTAPTSAWRPINLKGVSRAYRTPKILDQKITLSGYQGPIRQIVIKDLGHEEPTFLLTNQLKQSAAKLVERYAQRMVIENSIQDGIDFFHIDALSSTVALKVNCDLQLTLMGSSLYRLLGRQIGNGYEIAKSQKIFRDFINATANITIEEKEIIVQFQKRAHNPLLINAGLDKTDIPIPWLAQKRLRFQFG